MPVITVEQLHKRYGDVVAVEDVSFSVEEGEIVGLLGPNGAGKTTTVETIAGLRVPDSGRVSVLGRDPRDPELRQLVGIQLQTSELQGKLRVREALELFASFYREPADWRELADALELRLDAPFAKLSGGQQQRVSIALALIGSPRIAILDELTTGLDPAARRDTWALIEGVRERGVTVVLVTHFMEEAERLADRVVLIDHGRVVATDTPAALAGGTRMSFRASIDPALLDALPEVVWLRQEGSKFELGGGEELVGAVTALLARRGVLAERLRVEQGTLEDAFVELTR